MLICRIVTSEGLNIFMAASTYTRLRMAQQLLPLLDNAASTGSLARVVDVAGGTKEGAIDTSDIAALNMPLSKVRPHLTSVHTLSLEALAEEAPRVSFVHNFPGAVYTNLQTGAPGIIGVILRGLLPLLYYTFGYWVFVPIEEAGERQVYFATSNKYEPAQGRSTGVPLGGEEVAPGSDGLDGSGVYSVNWDGEPGSQHSLKILHELRNNGVREKVWAHMTSEYARITGGS